MSNAVMRVTAFICYNARPDDITKLKPQMP